MECDGVEPMCIYLLSFAAILEGILLATLTGAARNHNADFDTYGLYSQQTFTQVRHSLHHSHHHASLSLSLGWYTLTHSITITIIIITIVITLTTTTSSSS